MILLVGAGQMAISYAKVLNALGVDWICVGRGKESADKFQAATGKPPLINYKFLKTTIPEYAIVSVTIPQLAIVTEFLIGSGIKKILVEKPAGATPEEIYQLALYPNIYVAYNRRFYASVMELKHILETEQVASFYFNFSERHPKDFSEYWFLANSSHVLDLAFYLGGNAPFDWYADWTSPGQWSVIVETHQHNIFELRPLEKLSVNGKRWLIDDELDHKFKPGLYQQTKAFLSDNPYPLPTIKEHANNVRRWLEILKDESRGRGSWQHRQETHGINQTIAG